MRHHQMLASVALTLVLFAVAHPAAAQSGITSTEVQRLQDSLDDASRDVAQLSSRDAALGTQLQRDIDEAREEANYLKVKARKNEPVARGGLLDPARSHRAHSIACTWCDARGVGGGRSAAGARAKCDPR